jgi:hypothetical protein
MIDFDQGGVDLSQLIHINAGPSLGWQRQRVMPQARITTGGTFRLVGAGVVLVNFNGSVVIALPSVKSLFQQASTLAPSPVMGQGIVVKDLGGFASAANPIVILPSGTDLIDGQVSFSIITPGDLIRLWPLTDQSGFYVG